MLLLRDKETKRFIHQSTGELDFIVNLNRPAATPDDMMCAERHKSNNRKP